MCWKARRDFSVPFKVPLLHSGPRWARYRDGWLARTERAECAGLVVLRGQALSRLRPLARRRLSTERPAFVAIRLRKPWSRLRLRLLGWKVRFTVRTSKESHRITAGELRR